MATTALEREVRCPDCSGFLVRGFPGTDVNLVCSNGRCRAKVRVEITDQVRVTVLVHGKQAR